MAVKRSEVSNGNLAKQTGLKLDKMIKAGNFRAFADELQRICGIFVINDFTMDDEFINAIKQNRMTTYGSSYELRAYGKVYGIDYKKQDLQEKEINVACNKTVKIKYVICGQPFDSQVPDEYVDYLNINIDKAIPVSLGLDELRKIACGENTYNELVALITSKITAAINEMLYDIVICELNNPENYKEITTLTYCCDNCEGTSMLSALNTFALKLRRTTYKYNLQGRDYNLPTNQMWMLKSFDTDSKIMGILSGKFNSALVNVETKFARTFPVELNIADVVICDKRWPQLDEVLQNVIWDYDRVNRANCGWGDYVARLKFVNFLTAAALKLVKVDCTLKQGAANIRSKIESDTTKPEADTEQEAKTAIDAIIKAAVGESKLNVETEYTGFKAPVDNVDGAITANVKITDEAGTLLEEFSKTFALKKKQ